MEKKIANNADGLEVRSFGEQAAPQVEEGTRKVSGYAIVFNQESRILYDRARKRHFVEVIEPRAVTEEFLAQCDIKMTRNHDDDLLLARSYHGSGTLKFSIDDYGVRYEFDMPDSPTGNDTLESLKRGDLFGSSFKFVDASDGVKVERLEGGKIFKRTVVKFADIRDFSIVADPAYYGTYVSARSLGADDPEVEEGWEEKLAEQCKGIEL